MQREGSLNDFGLVISFLIPGLVALGGLRIPLPELSDWFGVTSSNAPTVGGFLYLTLAALAAGLTVSTLRWATIDTIHSFLGVRQPEWDFRALQANATGFRILLDIHYRYYQFYANSTVAILFVLIARRFGAPLPWTWLDTGCIALSGLFFWGSRDTLQKYYQRTEQLLQTSLPLTSEVFPNECAPALSSFETGESSTSK